MRIDPEQVEYIAKLARLYTSEDEKETFGNQLSKILDYIEKLNELDTTDVPPTSHVIELTNVARKDSHEASLPLDEALRNAPDRAENFYRVPKIIE
jgi:aspartyl-tRNA(Asn)/glutamyl-tRNA(Gln) amidotransferase subunit C